MSKSYTQPVASEQYHVRVHASRRGKSQWKYDVIDLRAQCLLVN